MNDTPPETPVQVQERRRLAAHEFIVNKAHTWMDDPVGAIMEGHIAGAVYGETYVEGRIAEALAMAKKTAELLERSVAQGEVLAAEVKRLRGGR